MTMACLAGIPADRHQSRLDEWRDKSTLRPHGALL